jgi:hypothetical protein
MKPPKNPRLRAPRTPADARERARLLARASKNLAEVNQIFIDVASWNENARKPHEAPIDPDPDGMLAELRRYYTELLRNAVD